MLSPEGLPSPLTNSHWHPAYKLLILSLGVAAPHQTPVTGAWTSPLAPVSQEPVNHSPWPPPCSVPLMHHLALPRWVPEGPQVLTNGYQGGYRLELCPELQTPGLLAVTESTVSKDEERLTRPHLWLRSYWQLTATGERRVILLWCGHYRLPMPQWMSAHPCTCKQH